MKIAVDLTPDDMPHPKSWGLDGEINCREPVWAERAHRQIIEAFEGIETVETLDAYYEAEAPILHALARDQGRLADAVHTAYHEIRIVLAAGAERFAASASGGTGHQTESKPMAKNTVFKKVVLKDVELVYPKLDQPYRFNPQTQNSEPCASNASQAAYSVTVSVPMAEAKAIKEELQAHYQACLAEDPTLPPYERIFGAKPDAENGVVKFTIKRNAMSQAGKVNKPPVVVDGAHNDLADKAIWSGSKGHVRALAYPAKNPQDGNGGISLMLDAVVVTEAHYAGANLADDFGAPAEADPTAGLASAMQDQTQQAAQQPAMAGDEF